MSGRIICGVDEVGRGPLAGPVVAACVIIPDKTHAWLEKIKDSKKLSRKARVELASLIKANCCWGLSSCDVQTIDQINIFQAAMQAMREAILNCSTLPDYAYIDGNHVPRTLPCEGEAVIKGDDKIMEIAAASIIAKVHRDNYMEQIGNDFPHYEWHRNAGYGTVKHLAALREHGATIHHRQSFAPIKNLLQK